MSQTKLGPPGGARSPWLDGLVGGVAAFAIVVGWPSAVVLFFAHTWGSVFTSDAAVDAVRAIVLAFACFGALAFAVMGFGPWMEETRLSGRSLLALLGVAFGPTIALALFFYGHP
jgi:hypothetical protein